MSVPKCLFFQDLEGLTEVFGRMSAGISGPKLPLWADFSFLIFVVSQTIAATTTPLLSVKQWPIAIQRQSLGGGAGIAEKVCL